VELDFERRGFHRSGLLFRATLTLLVSLLAPCRILQSAALFFIYCQRSTMYENFLTTTHFRAGGNFLAILLGATMLNIRFLSLILFCL